MAGYKGKSMSNNAVRAYADGEMPLSKWSKAAILNAISQANENGETNLDLALLRKISLKDLRNFALKKSSWHHTSKFYNKTNFYELDIESLSKWDNNDLEAKLARDDEFRNIDNIAGIPATVRMVFTPSYDNEPVSARKFTKTGEIKGNVFVRTFNMKFGNGQTAPHTEYYYLPACEKWEIVEE